MKKLYVFVIGESGVRFLKQLGMILACGVGSNFDEVVPVLIGDSWNSDITDFLGKYKALHQNYVANKDVSEIFFRTKAKQTGNVKINVDCNNFGDYIEIQNLNENDKALAYLLFSDKNLITNLKTDLRQGLNDQANIGSVIFANEYENSMNKILQDCDERSDKICVVGSCSEDYDASGFLALIRKIKRDKPRANVQNIELQQCNGYYEAAVKIGDFYVLSPDLRRKMKAFYYFSYFMSMPTNNKNYKEITSRDQEWVKKYKDEYENLRHQLNSYCEECCGIFKQIKANDRFGISINLEDDKCIELLRTRFDRQFKADKISGDNRNILDFCSKVFLGFVDEIEKR